MIDAEHRHNNLLLRGGSLLPKLTVTKGLWYAPERFLREAKLGLVLTKGV